MAQQNMEQQSSKSAITKHGNFRYEPPRVEVMKLEAIVSGGVGSATDNQSMSARE